MLTKAAAQGVTQGEDYEGGDDELEALEDEEEKEQTNPDGGEDKGKDFELLTDNLEEAADALLKDEPLKGAEEEEEGMDSPGRNMQASMESLHSQHKLTSQEEQEIEEYKKVKELSLIHI